MNSYFQMVAMEMTEGLETQVYPETSQEQETIMVHHPVQGPADQVTTTTDLTDIVEGDGM